MGIKRIGWIVLVLGVMLLSAAPASAGSWNLVTVDSTNADRRGIAMVLDASGYPVISYVDATTGQLKLIHCTNADCSGGQTAQVVASSVWVDFKTSLRLDSAGNPVILYNVNINDGVKIAHCADPACTSSTINTVYAGQLSYDVTDAALALNASGHPIIAMVYDDGFNTNLGLAQCNDANCASASFEGLYAGDFKKVSLELTSSGLPRILYQIGNNLQLILCSTTGCTETSPVWVQFATASFSVLPENSALTITSDDLPVVAANVSGESLAVYRCNDTVCTSFTSALLDSTVPGPFAVEVDNSNRPVVGYYKSGLWVFRCPTANCYPYQPLSSVVDATSGAGQNTHALALDASFLPVLVYQEETSADLKLARWVSTALSAPANLSASYTGDTSATLTWDTYPDNETNFFLETSTDQVNWTETFVFPDETSANAVAGNCETTYYFRLRAFSAVDQVYSPYSNTVSVLARPCQPGNVLASANLPQQIDVTWADTSTTEDSYVIERAPFGSASWSQLDTVAADSTGYTDTSVACGTRYAYRIYALRDSIASVVSSEAWAETARCVLPTNVPEWTWVDGPKESAQAGAYGTEDVPDPANVPGGRDSAARWMDAAGNLWLYGGAGYDSLGQFGLLSDLWKFDPVTGEWTWVDGSLLVSATPVYSSGNPADLTPGARSGSAAWIDGMGKLWLFGGLSRNDLWSFDPSTGLWTFVTGSQLLNQTSTATHPGSRFRMAAWTDALGDFWIYGGMGRDLTASTGALADLWKFDPDTITWTRVDSGIHTNNEAPAYGAEDIADPANWPGSRIGAAVWQDSTGRVWLFGGSSTTNTSITRNDMWSYDPVSGDWTWEDGPTTTGDVGTYGVQGLPDPNNVPRARINAVAWADSHDQLWLYGGTLGTDLWRLNPNTEMWVWERGYMPDSSRRASFYGTEDVAAEENSPGNRTVNGTPAGWVDSSDTLWMFGGEGTDHRMVSNRLSTLWTFDTRADYDSPVDYNADRDSEVTIFRGGAWHLYNYSDGSLLTSVWTGIGSPTAYPLMMDYDGDGSDDLTVYDSGAWHFFNDDGTYNKGVWVAFDAIPVPADYNGDDVDELVLFDLGAWHKFDFTTGAYLGGVWTGTGTGSPAYPAPMDYNGDGTDDFTVYNSGAWHFFNDNGTYNKGIWVAYPNGIPVPGDYNGDGTDDVVLWQEDSGGGAWHWFDFATGNYSVANSVYTPAPAHKYALPRMPAPLDVNGDGTMDRTVYLGGPWNFFAYDGSFIKNIPTGGVVGDQDVSGRPALP